MKKIKIKQQATSTVYNLGMSVRYEESCMFLCGLKWYQNNERKKKTIKITTRSRAGATARATEAITRARESVSVRARAGEKEKYEK